MRLGFLDKTDVDGRELSNSCNNLAPKLRRNDDSRAPE